MDNKFVRERMKYLQKKRRGIMETLINRFSDCLTLGRVSEKLGEVKIAFILEAGEASNTTPKDLRSIGLSSFSLNHYKFWTINILRDKQKWKKNVWHNMLSCRISQ